MPFKYIVGQNAGDSHQTSVQWMALIVRFKNVISFDRSKIKLQAGIGDMDVSTAAAKANPVEEKEPLILTDRITSWSINNSKSSHTSGASFVVAPGDTRFEYEVNAGDWILFWAFDNEADFTRVLGNLQLSLGIINKNARIDISASDFEKSLGKTVNGFMDGLKFVGRLNAPKRAREVDGQGVMRTSYNLSAVGFGEFDSQIHFDEAARARDAEFAVPVIHQMSQFGPDSNTAKTIAGAIDGAAANANPISSEDHIKKWLSIFLGVGPTDYAKGFQNEGASAIVSANDRFLVPKTIGSLISKHPAGQAYTYVDLLSIFLGVQAPSESGTKPATRDDGYTDIPKNGFAIRPAAPLLGAFFTSAIQFSQTTVWELLRNFLNEPMNEMYVSLRLNNDGRVGPTLIARQLPFFGIPGEKLTAPSNQFEEQTHEDILHALLDELINDPNTKKNAKLINTKPSLALEMQKNARARREAVDDAIASGATNVAVTLFLDLPRWVIHPTIVQSELLGPSDSLRSNYIKVPGYDMVNDTFEPSVDSDWVINPPILDSADIQRNGLRTFIQPTRADIRGIVDETGKKGRIFTNMMASILIDQHLKWTGTLSTKGIQEPIAIGDNLEYDDLILHIESVVHEGWIDPTGKKNFTTKLALSHGVSIVSDAVRTLVLPAEVPKYESTNITSESRSKT